MKLSMRRLFQLALLVAAAAPAPWLLADGGERVVNLAMEDQFKNRHETLRMRGDVVVLV